MTEISDEVYFSVCYDIERPWNKHWSEVLQKPSEELTPEEKQEIQRRRDWDRLISRFINELDKIGFRINWSVYLIPNKYYDKAKSIVDRYTKRFNDIGARNDIYILKYHPDSNEVLLSKVTLHMKLKIEKLVKYYAKAKEKDDTSEERFVKRELELIFDLAKAFGIEDRIKSYYDTLLKEYKINISIHGTQRSLDDLVRLYE